MKAFIKWLFSLLSVVLVLGGLGYGEAHEHESWYRDMNNHWARQEVLTLWEEGVTDGQWIQLIHREDWLFRPNHAASRAQFGMLAAKVFQLSPFSPAQPSFVDLDSSYRFYHTKQPYPYIEAAFSARIIQGVGNNRFAPSHAITREQAVAMLIRALGLAAYANAQSRDQQNSWLAAFSDRRQVDGSIHAKVALAAHLGIIRGYPDGRLRPRRSLRRAEAATIFYRSAVFRLSASPETFHPDGDGYREATTLHLNYLANRNVRRWSLEITNDRGLPVFTTGITPWHPPSQFRWPGTDMDGRPLADGLYFYRGWLDDRRNQRFYAVPRPLQLTRRHLGARLEPTAARTGDEVTVWAWTRGGADGVRAAHGNGWDAELARVEENAGQPLWYARFIMPEGDKLDFPVTVTATFPGAERQVSLFLRRLDALWVEGEVEPNPAPAGTEVTVRAFTPGDADRVTYQVDGGDAETMERTAPGTWTGTHATDAAAEGTVPIMITAVRGNRNVDTVVWLELTESPLDGVAFILVD